RRAATGAKMCPASIFVYDNRRPMLGAPSTKRIQIFRLQRNLAKLDIPFAEQSLRINSTIMLHHIRQSSKPFGEQPSLFMSNSQLVKRELNFGQFRQPI